KRRAFLVSALDRLADRRGHVGPMPLKLVEERARLEHEDAAVPAIMAIGQEALGGRGVGLLDEAFHLEAAVERGAAADVAVTRLGRGRRNAERDQPVV